jgi:hypothetical protein
MVITVKNHYKMHTVIFALLSIQFFIFTPVSFINKILAAAVCLSVSLHIKEIKFDLKRWYEIVIFVIVNAYLTLAIFGYDLLLTNTVHTERLLNVFIFGMGFIWTSYVLQSFLDAIKSLGHIINRVCIPSNGHYWRKWLILLVIMSMLFLIWQRAFNPIVMSPDSWSYIDGWRRDYYSSFRSPVYSFLVSIICHLAPTKPEVEWVAIAQILAFSSLLASILMHFHKKWIRFRYIIPAAIILPIIPSFALHTIVVWCDLANGMTILWLTYVLVRVLDEVIIQNTASGRQKISLCIQLCIIMTLAFFIRSNSFLVYLVMAPVLALLFLLHKQWKLLTSVVLTVVFVFLIRFPGYDALNVHIDGYSGKAKYFAAIHDIQATYYSGGKLSEQTQNMLRKHIQKLDDTDAKAAFKPDWVSYQSQFYAYNLSELTFAGFLSMYMDSFIHNPAKMVKSMLFRVRAYWVIDTKGAIGCVNYTAIYNHSTDIYSDQAPEISVYRQSNFLTRIANIYIKSMTLTIPATFIWRFGFWTAFLILSMLSFILQKRYIWLITYLPVFVYLVTLFLTSGWTDYRYGLPVFFIGLFLPLTLLMLNPQKAVNEDLK